MPRRNTQPSKEAKTYNHSEEHPQRPDVGTQAQFKKQKPPANYRYDSSLSPALDWDNNPTREQAEAQIAALASHLNQLSQQLAELDKVKVKDPSAMSTLNSVKQAIASQIQQANTTLQKLRALSQPFLNWTGKAERLSFDVPTLPLFVHERLSTRAILETLKSHQTYEASMPLFELFNDPQWTITDQILRAYEHHDKWVNRMILGDSLVVMNSLLQYEGLGGQVQMIYIDPPYGVKFGSNFQPFVRKRDVKHNDDDDFTREPEMVQAYRDTWELGLHSYLSYLRDRLLLARELLTDSGSVFVQIGEENVHHVRELIEEIFGQENFVAHISFRTKSSLGTNLLASEHDYIIWYTKNKDLLKFRQIYEERSVTEDTHMNYVEFSDKTWRTLTIEEKSNPRLLPNDARVFRLQPLISAGYTPSCTYTYELDGKLYKCSNNKSWKTNKEGMEKLAKAGRIVSTGVSIQYIKYHDDFCFKKIVNVWNDTHAEQNKLYVVQTDIKAITRCLLMTTDPGDIVLDLTCLRKGTKILIPNSSADFPPNPPFKGGALENSPPMSGGQGGVGSEMERIIPPNPPFKGGAWENSPPMSGGQGGVNLKAIEELKPGDYVIGHDLQPHRIIRTICKTHQGIMVGIRHQLCNQTLWVTGDHRILCQKRTTSYGGDRTWNHISKDNFGLAQNMRKEPTAAESKLWQALRGNQLGVKFRRQHLIGRYITDFYAREKGCIIEVDGDSHYTPEAIIYDQERTLYLESLGLTVLRFTNEDVYHNLEGVLDKIQLVLNAVEQCSDDHYREWRRSDRLKVGDIVYFGEKQLPCEIVHLEYEITTETVYDLEIENVHSFITEVCTVHNCGSGTTAYVAEQWGRRWITCDVSRVPLALARQRLLTATFPWYELKDGNSPANGFIYKRKQNRKGEEIGGIVPHITLKSIANNELPEEEILVDRPEIDNSIVRVCSPFTIEGTIPPPVDMEDSEAPETQAVEPDSTASFTDRMLEVLRKSPVLRLPNNKTVTFTHVRQPARTQILSAEALVKPSDLGDVTLSEIVDEVVEINQNMLPLSQKLVAFLFGPENGAIAERTVYEAAKEASAKQYHHLYIIGFAISANARQLIENCHNLVNIPATYIQATPDLLMGDLLKNMRSSQIFSVCGMPEIEVKQTKEGKYQVELLGLDVFDPVKMEVDHELGRNVPAWFLDTKYNGLCFHVNQAFFPRTSAWESIKKALKGTYEDSVWEHLSGTLSTPFDKGEQGQIAVKVIDDRGNELLVVKDLNEVER